MATFLSAYSIVWLALALYVLRLRNDQRRLGRLAETLRAQLRNGPVWAEADCHADPDGGLQ